MRRAPPLPPGFVVSFPGDVVGLDLPSPAAGGERARRERQSAEALFADLPVQRAPLDADAIAFLRGLPVWDTVQEISDEQQALCRILERRGAVRVNREKTDPIQTEPSWSAGLTEAGVAELAALGIAPDA